MKPRRFALVLALLALALPAGGQSVLGSVEGTVTDDAGKPLPGALVETRHELTNQTRSTVTSRTGAFLLPMLPPGTYRLEVRADGYQPFVRELILQINQKMLFQIALAAGTLSETVEVSAARELLRVENSALGAVIDNRQITGLPLDGRNFFALSLLLPGTAPAAEGSAGSVRGDFALHVNGAREDSNQFLLDGVYNADPKLNGFAVNPPVDAIHEFEVLTHAYDASFGRNAGGQVNVALKSGGNEFHGTVYEFFRNNVFDARNFFSPREEPAPRNQRNQFGFSLGGPIVRDRTFFFGDYEGRILNQGVTRIANVPTLAERTGDFSQSLLPVPIDPFTGQPFPGGVIPADRLHRIGEAIAALYPQPNRARPGENFISSPILRDREHHFDVRVDHKFSSNADLAVRYSFADRDLFEPFSGPLFAAVPGYGTNVLRRAQNLMVSETLTLAPSLFNEFRTALNRVAIGVFQENLGASLNSAVGLPELSARPRDFGLSLLRIPGFSPLGDEFNNPQESVSSTYQLLDQVTHIRGAHLLRFGLDFRAVRQIGFRDVQARGFLDFLGAVTGNPLADMLLGFPTLTGGAQLDNPQNLRTESYAFFLQDRFRLHPHLSITAGLRYEFISPPVDLNDRATVYDPVTQTLIPVGGSGVPRSGYRSDANNWGPRLGLAWDIKGKQQTVLRAGYGIYYEQSSLAPGEGLYFNPPFFDFRLFFSLPGLPLTLDDPFPANFPVALPPSALSFQRDLQLPYMQHWSLTLQRELGAGRMVEFGYVGSKGTHLLTARDINQPLPSPVIPNLRPVPEFADINLLESRADSSYHSLQVRFQQTLSDGLSMLSSYAWSKSLDDASGFFSSTGDPNFPQDSLNPDAERARSNFDTRHRLTLSYSYDLPRPQNLEGWRRALLADWQSSGIITFQSGHPFTVALLPELDNSNTGRSILGFGANDRPDVSAQPTLQNPAPEIWFDPAAFELPPFGTFGNAGRNILEGPGLQTFNLSLLKHFRLHESTSIQLRAEFFNIMNRANFDLPDNFLGSATFGRILSAHNPRRIQFGLKLLF